MRRIAIRLPIFAICLAGCGGRTGLEVRSTEPGDASTGGAGVIHFPTGTFTNCAQGLYPDDVSMFLNISGFAGAAITVTQRDSTLTATYGSGDHDAFDFAATAVTSAALAPSPQTGTGFGGGYCILGIGVTRFYPTDMHAATGALTYDAGTVFIALRGTLSADVTACGPRSSPATAWFICDGGPAPPHLDPAPPAVVDVRLGDYSCHSQVATHIHVEGVDQYVTSGGDGTLTLARSGSGLTARYIGDASLTGALRLIGTGTATANAEPGQSLSAPCEVPFGAGPGPPQNVPLAAASLAWTDAALVLSINGTLGAGSSCPGAQKAAAVICSMM